VQLANLFVVVHDEDVRAANDFIAWGDFGFVLYGMVAHSFTAGGFCSAG
jgi:hypothetical protein